MAPCTYVRLALSAPPGSRIRFRSLEFIDADGLRATLSLLSGQALRSGDLNFIANRLGQLHLYEGNVAPPQTPSRNPRLIRTGPTIVDSNALARRIDACLWTNPEPEQSHCMFYMQANTFVQLSGGELMPPKLDPTW
jgi:hypothetical protein